MCQPRLDQPVERPIHLQRRPEALLAQPVEDIVSRQRRISPVQREQHLLVARQVAGLLVVVMVMRMGRRGILLPFERRAPAAPRCA